MPKADLDELTRHARRWADVVWEKGWHSHAIDVLDRAIELNPECYKLYRKRGALYLSCPDSTIRDEVQGVADLRKACELAGWRNDLTRWVIGLLVEHGFKSEAKSLVKEHQKHARSGDRD